MADDNLSQRVTELELLVTHVQRELEQLGEVVLSQQAVLTQQRQQLEELQQLLARSEGIDDEEQME